MRPLTLAEGFCSNWDRTQALCTVHDDYLYTMYIATDQQLQTFILRRGICQDNPEGAPGLLSKMPRHTVVKGETLSKEQVEDNISCLLV